MKIQIEHSNGIKLTAEALSDRLDKTEVMDISGRMYDMIDMVHRYTTKDTCHTCQNCTEASKEEAVQAVVQAAKEISETPLIRPRIPNNVVDINELTIEKAVTEKALVRCPHCGQAHCLAVPSNNHIYLMRRDFTKDEFGIVAEFDSATSEDFVGICCKPETDRQAYYNDLQSLSFEGDTDFAVDNNTEIFCPVCCVSSTFNLWKDAFENPLDFFETEHLCDACGGEKIDRFIKKRHVYQCDKCGLQTDFKEDK